MDTLMIPIVQASKAVAAVDVKTPASDKTGSNFSDYMEKKVATDRQAKNSLLGVQNDKATTTAAVADQKTTDDATDKKDGATQATTIAALLAQFVQELQKTADDKKLGPGEWSFQVPTQELLQKIAKDAGMNESQLTALLEKMKNQDGKLNLADFLDSLSRHFQNLQNDTPVTAPETDLPLLQTVFERLGVPVSQVSKISEAAVRGNNTIDLQKILAGLQTQTGERTTDLTPVEAAQLQDFLANAGVSQQLQRALLPEQVPVMEGLVKSGPPLTLTLSRLKNMMAQTVQEVKSNRLQADPISFLTDLQDVLTKSSFETKGPSLSSAVQGSVNSVFKKLMESVDFAKVKVQQGVKSQLSESLAEKKGLDDWQENGVQKVEEVVLGAETTQSHTQGGDALADGVFGKKTGASGDLFTENNSIFQADTAVATLADSVGTAAGSSQAARPFVNIPNMPLGLQQQSFAQLSQGVLQGLRNQEHHLVLRLYPKELGEVKVEMTVRDNQVAVSFAMENSKVKEVLESNLEQFKENMAKQGFALGECMVSLNKDTDSNESWQQYQSASIEKGTGQRRTTLADLPDDIFYQHAQPGTGRETGVDLFA